MINGLYIVPILGVLILIHEVGHFVAARLIGVRVEEFGIGIPPRLKGWRHRGVLWSLNWIPFGGFVKVLGEDSKSGDPESINSKSPLQRAFFLAAGSFMNFALAFVLMILVVGAQGISSSNVYVADLIAESPAATAGWVGGDRIVEVGGGPVASPNDVGARTREFAGRPLSVVIERDGALIETSVTPRINPPAGEGATGVQIVDATISEAIVADVTADSPAAAAGFETGDQLLTIGSEPIGDTYALQYALTNAANSTVPVDVQRGSARETLSLVVPSLD
ncbi:MAG: site-2 protease family protein, partial [Chloroflexia bacterium]|nr:site-2 protease family protein [Chloroflexia bacterium]